MSLIMEVLEAGYSVIKIQKHTDGTYSAYIDGEYKKEIELYADSIPELDVKIQEAIKE